MSTATRKASERLDRHDPTLAVDGLSEFLLLESDPTVDPMLVVSALHEFFSEERTAPPVINNINDINEINETPFLPSCDAGLETGGLVDYFDYFRDREDAPTVIYDDDRFAQNPQDDVEVDIDVVDVPAENLGFRSEIQRAAMDFQRFAEKFHAFASQCQHRARTLLDLF